jgi:hypothetical protein
MKTAVQQVFSELEELHPNLFNINTTEGKEFVHHFHKYISMEREQIEEAYMVGYYNHSVNSIMDSEEYYEQNYNKSINNKG